MALVEMKGIYKGFLPKENQVLRGVTLTIEQGQSYVLTGPSGSGKTTLLHVLALLLRVDEGILLVEGVDTALWRERDYARWRNTNVGLVFQDFCLLPELTVLDNVLLPARIGGDKGKRERAKELLKRVGLEKLQDCEPRRLSGGEAQRVAIARALLLRPKLILADEPTGNLPEGKGREVLSLILELQQKSGSALVFVTHNMNLARELPGKKLYLKDGVLHRIQEEDLQ